ncbi:MAG TPA: hypothetical protein VIF83_01640 [Gemmatimonadaceae bacterium]|jgi:hypothetical protein
MTRTLSIQRSTVTSAERERYLTAVAERKSQYARANCRFWVFEEIGLPGAFVEFTESDSASSLRSAHESVGYLVGPPRIYQEVDLG